MDSSEFIRILEDSTVSYSNGLGGRSFIPGAFAQTFRVTVKVEIDQYDNGVAMMGDLLWGIQFSHDRLLVAAKRLLSRVQRMKNDGDSVSTTACKTFCFDDDSNFTICNFLTQKKFLRTIIAKLSDEKEREGVLADLSSFRAQLCQPSNMRFHCVTNLTKVNMMDVWHTQLGMHRVTMTDSVSDSSHYMKPITFSAHHHTQILQAPESAQVVIKMPSCQSAYMVSAASIGHSDHEHKDRVAIDVLLEYLTTTEGPFYKRIRGKGYAYGYDMYESIEKGMIYFSLYRATNIVEAYKEAYSTVIALRKDGLDELAIEAAKSCVVFRFLSSADSMAGAAWALFKDQLTGVSPGWYQRALAQVKDVKADDMMRCLPLAERVFDASTSVSVVTANPGQAEAIVGGFVTNDRSQRAMEVSESVGEFFGVEDDEDDHEDFEGDEGDEGDEEDEEDDKITPELN